MIKKMNKSIFLEGGVLYDPYKDIMQKGSILIENGLIKKIGSVSSKKNTKIINCKNKIISPGFIDIHAHFREPGREDKETLVSGSYAAIAGGFTKVCVMPNTNPPLDSPESISFIIKKSANLPINIYPIGAITIKQKGEEMAEIGGMVSAGAVAISDDGMPLQNGQILRNALEYAQKYNVPLINHAEDVYLRNNGVMNESSISSELGLPGNPDISESIMVHRDLEIADYCDGRIHIPHVSSYRSVELIRKYKKKGVKVTAEVTPHHIGLTEKILFNYNTNAKVAPPLRKNIDRNALIEGLIDGTIDCIATDHAPHTIEEKEMDFIHAPCGMIGMESAFGLSNTILSKAGQSIEKTIQLFTKGPASVMGWEFNSFQIDQLADIVILDPSMKWKFNKNNIFSRSNNSPMIGMDFIGKVEVVISKNYIWNSSGLNLD